MTIKISKRNQKRLITALVGLVIVLLGYLSEANTTDQQQIVELSPGSYRVTKVHDGDTISVDMDGKEEEIRFIGVDTPETQDPRKPVQCFGKAASVFTKDLIGNQPVRLEADTLSSNRDRYNRLLRYVYLPDGRLVQAEIIKQGFGFAMTGFPHSKMEEFQTFQAEARQNNLGLWGGCTPTEKNGIFTSPAE